MIRILKKEIVFVVVLIISVFIIYGKSINFELLNLDDNKIISNGVNYIADVNNLHKLFLTDCYYTNNFTYYRPVLTLTFMLESIVFGFNPGIYHFFNIILFILSLFFIYAFLSKLKLNRNVLKFVCLLTAVHPIFTSNVVWISSRNDTLLTIFICLSFINLINYLEINKTKYLLLHLLFFSIAMFTKETAIITIPMYIIFIYCFGYKITKEQLIKNIVFLGLILLIYFILRTISVQSIGIENYLVNFKEYSLNMITAMMTYIDKIIIPDYIPTMLYKIKLSIKTIAVNIIVIGLLVTLYLKKIIPPKNIIFGILWFLLYLFPTFLNTDYQFLFHRLILPISAVIIILVAIVNKVISKYPVSKKYLVGLFIILFMTYSYASYKQMGKYKNSDIFWINSYLDAPNYHKACFGFAQCYMNSGNYQKSKDLIQQAIELSPEKEYLIALITVSLLIDNDLDKAEQEYLKIENKDALCFAQLSMIYYRKNDLNKALEYAKKAVAIEQNLEYLQHLGEMYIKNNEYDNAIKIYLKLIKINNNPKFYYILESLYENTGGKQKAIEYKQKAPKN